MSSKELVEVVSSEDKHKWRVPLKEDVFGVFMAKGGPMVQKVFDRKSLFGPLLFTKFFDPSDAFPLWEFEPAVVLSHLHNPCVDWFQTDASCILKSQLPKEIEKNSVGICVENGKVIEISGVWKKSSDHPHDWRSGKWWEHGFVRRLELPDNTNWKKMEVYLNTTTTTTTLLDIRLPKTTTPPTPLLMEPRGGGGGGGGNEGHQSASATTN